MPGGADTMTQANVSFSVPDEARGKSRPRVTRHGTYTPDPAGWVQRVGEEGRMARLDPTVAEFTGVVRMEVRVHRAMPKSWSQKKKRIMDGESCVSTPDTVNILAAICDALNHVLYADDRQVCDLSITKRWGKEHGTWITLRYGEAEA